MMGRKRLNSGQPDSNLDNDSTFGSKRKMAASPHPPDRTNLDPQRAQSSQHHVRALNTQFASWVQLQLQNHPDELWEDGVQDYLTHASHIMDKFSDVVDWLKANAAKANTEAIPAFGPRSSENKLTFGSSENKPTLGSSENKPTLGSSENKPTFGSSENKPTFGSSENKPTFGSSENKSTIGSSENKPTFGSSGNKSVFGSSDNKSIFGNTDKNSIFGNTDKKSVFGSTDNKSVFGSTDNKSVFGSTDYKSIFGSTDNKSIFGYNSNEKTFQVPDKSEVAQLGSTSSFASSWSSGIPQKSQTLVLFGGQNPAPAPAPAPVICDASDDPNGEDELEKPSSPSVKKSEEKGIVVVHEVKCKLYVKSIDPVDKDAWKDKGMGQLSIKCREGIDKATKESKPTVVVRNDVGKVLLNALIYPGIKTNLLKNAIAAIFHTSGDGSGNDADKVMARTYLIRTKTEEERNKLASTIQEYAPAA